MSLQVEDYLLMKNVNIRSLADVEYFWSKSPDVVALGSCMLNQTSYLGKFLFYECSLTFSQTSPVYLGVCTFLKALWEKEKLLVTGNFSFSHSVTRTFFQFHQI